MFVQPRRHTPEGRERHPLVSDHGEGRKQTCTQRRLILFRLINMHECFAIRSDGERQGEAEKWRERGRNGEEEEQQGSGTLIQQHLI